MKQTVKQKTSSKEELQNRKKNMTSYIRFVITINISGINLPFTGRITTVFFRKPKYILCARDTHKQNDSKKIENERIGIPGKLY